MDEEFKAECGNNFAKKSKLDNAEHEELLASTLDANDIPMTESSSSTQTARSSQKNGEGESTEDSQNNCPEDAAMEDAKPGTSSNNKSTTKSRRPTGSVLKVGRFAKRNYRSVIFSSSSSSSTCSTPELRVERNGVESTDSSNQGIDDNQHNSTDNGDGASDDDNDNDDDDDDDDSSIYGYDLPNTESEDSAQPQNNTKSDSIKDLIMGKPKPNYKWSLIHEVMHRENGLPPRGRKTVSGRSSSSFQGRVYGARHTIEKLNLLHSLKEHDGCVNSLNFNKAGTLLASGSDDLKIILWDWASNKIKYSFSSGHNSNVFQTKFIELGGVNDINLVSSGRDGQVRYASIPPDGGSSIDTKSRVLLKHSGSVHKISPSPQNPYEILTAGEDGHVVRCDLRENKINRVVTVKVKKRKVPLYSIAHNPLDPQFCVCGRDQFIRVFDARYTRKPLFMMCPQHLEDKKAFVSHITCAVYNSTGTEVLGSYSDEDIYSFNSKLYVSGGFTHRYRGHNNNKTIKGVNYFGLNSEYVVSGSDCGNFFIWDQNTEAILNWKQADFSGVVNCLEPHPAFPILATSGLDHDVKIWAPTNEKFPPDMEGLEKCLKNNTKRSLLPESDLFDDRTFFFFVRQCLRNRRRTIASDSNCPNVDDLISTSSGDDDDDNDDDEDDDGCDQEDYNVQLRSFPPCTPQ